MIHAEALLLKCTIIYENSTFYMRLQPFPIVMRVPLIRPLFLPPPFSFLHLPFFCLTPLSFAPAPPYNHVASWLSFGAVYIAVIVRVQNEDWAERVYSLTGLLCSKSLRREGRIGEGSG
ncbi:hypothetical protein ILYODFUR_003787 [Ilyodon furcidens]|uniref:Uncharacterized protein n=1 Tax=Ilyodon furcidens TaxID=33524 RepID=A0ABV0UZZ8_9TELE